MVPAALLTNSRNPDGISLTNEYNQPSTYQTKTDSYPLFSSKRALASNRKGLRISFAFFQKVFLLEGPVEETVSTVELFSDC